MAYVKYVCSMCGAVGSYRHIGTHTGCRGGYGIPLSDQAALCAGLFGTPLGKQARS